MLCAVGWFIGLCTGARSRKVQRLTILIAPLVPIALLLSEGIWKSVSTGNVVWISWAAYFASCYGISLARIVALSCYFGQVSRRWAVDAKPASGDG